MALIDQLFRLRGAPRGGNPPVTLGAVVAALEPPPSNAESREVPAETGAPKAAPPPSLDATSQVPQVTSPPPGRISSDVKPAGGRPSNGLRFNPFASCSGNASGAAEKERSPESARTAGPCLDDPTLPPLRLEPQVQSEIPDRPLVLGAAVAIQTREDEAEPLRQIEPPAVRLAPVKAPARTSDPPHTQRALLLRLEIQAEPSLDVVAFKQHAAKFPGVVKCAISNAGD